MVATGNIGWDVVLLESRQVFRGAKEGVFDAIDYASVGRDDLIPEAMHANAVGVDFYTNQLAYSKKAFSSENHPKTMNEFWDVRKFPQRRVLRNQPYPNLEHAAQVIKGSPDGLYPINVDVAFAKLDEIRSAVKVWYTSGAQPGQLLADGEVDLAFGNGARFIDLINKGAPIGIEWMGSLDQDWWAVPKGTKRRDLAMKFIAFTVKPEVQADYVSKLPQGPVSKKSFNFIDANYARLLPTYPDNYKKLAKPDHAWWGENEATLEARWSAWILKK
jgi:putative spermidine/putrescine transport system substrate-binding protein